MIQARHLARVHGWQDTKAHGGNGQTAYTGQCAEHSTFEELSANQAQAAGAQRRLDSCRTPAAQAIDQQQVRHIGQRDQQNEGGRREQTEERLANAAYQVFVHQHRAQLIVLVALMGAAPVCDQSVELAVELLDADVGAPGDQTPGSSVRSGGRRSR